MRHGKAGRKLNRTPAHRRAMIRNLVTDLFLHGRVRTTPAKAKEARPFADKLITLAKQGTLHARQRALSLLHDRKVVGSLFNEIAPRYAQRPGGYCRVLHLSGTRVGDGAPQALFELVEETFEPKQRKGPKGADAGEPAPALAEAEKAAPAEESPSAPAPAAPEAEAEKPADEGGAEAEGDESVEGPAKSETD
jgi:large subunit ribosomal protein L17